MGGREGNVSKVGFWRLVRSLHGHVKRQSDIQTIFQPSAAGPQTRSDLLEMTGIAETLAAFVVGIKLV